MDRARRRLYRGAPLRDRRTRSMTDDRDRGCTKVARHPESKP